MRFSRWMNKLWYIQTIEYFATLKRDELSSHKKAWEICNSTLLSERKQSEKTTYCMIPTIWHSVKEKNYEDSKKISDCQRLGRRMGWVGRAQRIFRPVKALSIKLWWCVCVVINMTTFIEYTRPRVNSKAI